MATQSDRNNSWRSSPPNGKREGRDKENGETRLSLLVGVVVVVGVDCDNAYLADSCSVKGVHNATGKWCRFLFDKIPCHTCVNAELDFPPLSLASVITTPVNPSDSSSII